MKRFLTAIVLAPLITYSVIWAPFPFFGVVLAIIASLCYWEYCGLAAGNGIEVPRWPGIALGVGFLFMPSQLVYGVVFALLAMIWAMRAPDLKQSLPRAAAFTLGMMYVFGTWHMAVQLRLINSYWLFFALALNWIGDTAAMGVGKSIGRHKLAPRVSPGKSWEGSVGSVVASVLFAVAYGRWAFPEAPLWLPVAAAFAGNVAGQVGDLCESALKRGAGMKDSGTLLPGHGGWLDRVDSSLFSIPVVYAIVRLATT